MSLMLKQLLIQTRPAVLNSIFLYFDLEDGLIELSQVTLDLVHLEVNATLSKDVVYFEVLMQLKCQSVMDIMLCSINEHGQTRLALDELTLSPQL